MTAVRAGSGSSTVGSSPTRPGLHAEDVTALLACVESLGAPGDEDRWRRSALRVLTDLVPCTRVTWRDVDGTTGQATTVSEPAVRAVEPAPRHRLDVELATADAARVTIVLERGSPRFSERDRTMLELLSPHLAQGYENARLRGRLAALEPVLAPVERLAEPLGSLGLTCREAQVLALVAEGATNVDIAAHLGIRPGTVKKHLERIFHRLGVENRTAAAALVVRHVVAGGPVQA
jgi:DNA-binding CsgD family transcriptional regulator